MDAAKQINSLHCPRCDGTGTAIWRLHIRPRRLRDLIEFSAGFLCIDEGRGDPYFACAECRVPVVEREPNKAVAEIVTTLALGKMQGP